MTRQFLTLDDISVAGKTVLVRADLNVPMQQGRISDATRIERFLPTLNELRENGAKVVVISHFGRPNGKFTPSMSLAPLADALGEALGDKSLVRFGVDTVGKPAKEAVAQLNQGDVLLLENVRFHAEETDNDPEFAKEMASLGDVFVNDAFSCSHRAHASVTGLAEHLPAIAGRLMQQELEALSAALEQAERPLMAVVGGSKISSKITMLGALSSRVNMLVIGGGMANTFLAAQGHAVGASLCEHDMLDVARDILAQAEANDCRIILPEDAMVVEKFAAEQPGRIAKTGDVRESEMMLDVGPATMRTIEGALGECKTVLWNGPLGAFELTPYDVSSLHLARMVAARTAKRELTSVAGGGDTVAALRRAGLAAQLSYLSSAGGAFLEWLEGKTLPGVAALEDAAQQVAA